MNLPIEEKLEFVSEIIETFSGEFEIGNMRRHAESVNGKVPVKQFLPQRRNDAEIVGKL